MVLHLITLIVGVSREWHQKTKLTCVLSLIRTAEEFQKVGAESWSSASCTMGKSSFKFPFCVRNDRYEHRHYGFERKPTVTDDL